MTKYNYNTNLFEAPNEITYYLLGAYISDGNVDSKNQNKLTISSKDEDWIASISKIISSNSLPRKLKSSNCFAFYVCNKKIVDWFVANRCVPRKSLTVKMPLMPDEYFSHFMRGLFDGDGDIGIIKERSGKTHSLRMKITGGSKDFFNSIRNKLSVFDIKSNLYTIENKNVSIMGQPIKNYNDTYRLTFIGKNAVKFCEFIYQNDKIHLERKYQKYLEYIAIRKIEAGICTIREPFSDPNHILDLLKTKTYKEVGKIYNVSHTTVIGRLKAAGLYEEATKIRHSS
jgi:intein/homing endonuclease